MQQNTELEMNNVLTNNFGAVLFKMLYLMAISLVVAGLTDLDFAIALSLVVLAEFGTTLLRAYREKGAQETLQVRDNELQEAIEVANSNYDKYAEEKAKVAIFEQKNSDLLGRYEAAQSLTQSLGKKTESLEGQIKSLTEENKSLFLELTNMRAAHQKLAVAEQSLKTQTESLKEKNESLVLENQSLKDGSREVGEYIRSLKEDIDALNEQNRSLKAAKSADEGVKKRYAEMVEKLRNEIASLNGEVVEE